MDLPFFEFFRQALILLITLSLYWPLNIPLAALAYKVRIGSAPVPMRPVPFWLRSTFAALGLAIISVSVMGFDRFLTSVELPAGLVHVVMFSIYFPVGAGWMFYIYALGDFWEGLSTLLLYVFVPGLVLVLLKLLLGFDLPHFVNVPWWIA